MIALSLADIAAATGGTIQGIGAADAVRLTVAGGVVTDSRQSTEGSIYVARIGAKLDGHDFAAEAIERGAVAVLGSRPIPGAPTVVVKDVQHALGALARTIIERAADLTVIGITGSSGKTTTKDLLAAVLRTVGPTIAPVGSYNSEVGVPLTAARVDRATRFLVVEMGAKGVGHIDYLTSIAPPKIGVVLNVGSAHVGEFGSRAAIATAKGELVEALPLSGVAVLNADDPAVRAMASRTGARVVLVGEADDADYRAERVSLDTLGRAHFRAITPHGEADLELSVLGRHQVGNVLAVLAAAVECGVPLDRAATSVSTARLESRWRMEVVPRADGVTLINDAYNANPESMLAALDALAAVTLDGRRWAILGTMLELGSDSDREHASVGRAASRLGIDELLVVGEGAKAMIDTAGSTTMNARWVPDADAAAEILAGELRRGDVALFKSSRDIGLRWLADALGRQAEGEDQMGEHHS